MNLSEYDFCKQYTVEFLAMVNYPVDDHTIELIEKSREHALYKVNEEYKNDILYDMLIDEINHDYDKQLFDFIKKNVAEVDSEFFNERINNMNKILVTNKDYAIRLGMKVPARIIDDFYNNYLIATERILRAEINPVLS